MSAIRGKRKRPKNDDLVEGMGDALPVAIAHPSTNQAQSNAQLSEAEMQLVRGFLNDNSELVAQERVGLEVEEIANER